MKYICIFIVNIALGYWQKNPIIVKNNLVNLNCNQTTCSTISNWLASSTHKSLTYSNNQEKIDINWHNIEPEKAWQQLHQACHERTLKSYIADYDNSFIEAFNKSLQKPSQLLVKNNHWLLYGTDTEHSELQQLIPKQQPMLAVQLKWLILDEQAEQYLGLSHEGLIISPKNLTPSHDLWQLIITLKEWGLILEHLLQDLKKENHIITLSEPYLITEPEKNSSFQSTVLIPETIKDGHAKSKTTHDLPIDLHIRCRLLAHDFINLSINSHMHQPWQAKADNWPIAIHAINTSINLKLNSHIIIAKQKFLIANHQANNHNWLSFLRNNSQKNQHLMQLYVIASVKKAEN